jgi:hypothetical protein
MPLIRRHDVRGFITRKPVWLIRPLGLDTVRKQAAAMQVESRRFYEKASPRAEDAGVRQLLDDLAAEERTREDRAEELGKDKLGPRWLPYLPRRLPSSAVTMWVRGFICGLMTTLGGIGHTLPFIVPDFRAAMTAAVAVVLAELGIIAWIRHRYTESSALSATAAGRLRRNSGISLRAC